jgi:NADH dehydrogenase
MGEKAVKAAFPDATILRPSIIFGYEDQFFNTFASMARLSPVLPLIGGGRTRFQPVYVCDVARAVLTVLERSGSRGETYELGGPAIYTFRELMEYICRTTGRNPFLLNVPFELASFLSYFAELLPNPPITHDQVSMLQHDNVVNANAKTFTDLGISPEAVEAIVPQYLARYAKPGLAVVA